MIMTTSSSTNDKNSKKESTEEEAISKNKNDPKPLKLKGYVGFDKIASQYVNKVTKDGFAFNILCIGDTGIGKSTLMNTLFDTEFNLEPSTHHKSNVTLNSNTFELIEKGIRLKLTLIETSGYGDQINKVQSHEPIVKYINDQYELNVQKELSLKRNFNQINDTTIHLCLYFISPTGHSLKAIDLNTMKALDRRVNIIPVIAKADTISKNELNEFKKRIMLDINNNHVNIYHFPMNDHDLDISNMNASANALYPMAVIGSSELVKIGTKLIKGRSYEWGTVSVENESHCDFTKFRDMILSSNMMDLIELTHQKHYQSYRAQRLREIGFKDEKDNDFNTDSNGKHDSRNIFEMIGIKQAELDDNTQMRELEIKENFVKRVKEKEAELRDSEKDLNNKYNKFRREQSDWNDRLDRKHKELDTLIKNLNDRKFTLEKSRSMTLASMANEQRDKKSKKKH